MSQNANRYRPTKPAAMRERITMRELSREVRNRSCVR